MTVEHRKIRRREVHYGAFIDAGDGARRPCRLLDASEHGAQIEIDDTANLPERIDLILAPLGNSRRCARIVWRTDHLVGLKFENQPTRPTKPSNRVDAV